MDSSLWHLTIYWFLGYSIASMIASRLGVVPAYLTAQGPLTLIHTEYGKDTIDALARRFSAFWKVWGVLGVVMFLGGLVSGTALLALSAVQIANKPESASLAKDPQNLLVIPGVNDYLPLDAAPALVTALLIAMVIHELGHAIYCRLGDIEIDSTGLVLFALLPVGAFVEPDEDSHSNATTWNKIQMVSAGVMNNLGAVVVGMLFLVLLVPSLISPAPGVAIGGVLPDSPADNAGVESGDLIISVEGTSVQDTTEFQDALERTTTPTVSVTTSDGETHEISRHVFVTGAHKSSKLSPGDTITTVDGVEVSTSAEFMDAMRNAEDSVVALMTADGRSLTHIAGARVTIAPESPLSKFAAEDGTSYITSINGERIYDASALREQLVGASVGDTMVIEGVRTESGTPTRFHTEVEIPERGLQLAATSGVGGISVAELGVEFFPAEQYLEFITADGGQTIWSSIFLIVFLPFATVAGLPYNFAGFTPDIVGFYEVTGSLSPIAPLVFFFVSLLFWTVWINVNLALFNCLPTFALDGGHYSKYGLESVAKKLGSPNPKRTAKVASRAVALVVLAGIAVIVVLPPLLG